MLFVTNYVFYWENMRMRTEDCIVWWLYWWDMGTMLYYFPFTPLFCNILKNNEKLLIISPVGLTKVLRLSFYKKSYILFYCWWNWEVWRISKTYLKVIITQKTILWIFDQKNGVLMYCYLYICRCLSVKNIWKEFHLSKVWSLGKSWHVFKTRASLVR